MFDYGREAAGALNSVRPNGSSLTIHPMTEAPAVFQNSIVLDLCAVSMRQTAHQPVCAICELASA